MRKKNAAEVENSDSSPNDAHTGETLLKKRKGKDQDAGKNAAENDNSDSSSNDGGTDDSDDGVSGIFPTPVKKQSGIERLQRGRKIKASSPAGRKYPTRTCFDLLFDFL